MVKVLVIGDSIVYGSLDTEYGGWVDRFKLDCFENKSKFKIQNLGVSGDTSRGILKRLKVEIEKFLFIKNEQLIVIFSFGTNDSRFSQKTNSKKVSHNEFRDNLFEIYEIVKNYDVKILFTGLLGVDEKRVQPYVKNKTEFYDNHSILEYNHILRDFCLDNRIYFIEFFNLLEFETEFCDGLHPNEVGHSKIFSFMKLKFNEFVELNNL